MRASGQPFWQVRSNPEGNILPEQSATSAAAGSVFDLVWERNHDLLKLVLDTAVDGRSVNRGVGVRVWVDGQLVDATMCARGEDNQVTFSFLATLPDPLRATTAALSTGRDLASTLAAAVSVFGESNPALWVTVHYGRSDSDRYTQVVASSGHDTFRRSVEAAVAGESRCLWDESLPDDGDALALAGFGDGIALAGPRAGINTVTLIPIGFAGHDLGCVAVWSESAAQRTDPESMLVVRRALTAVTLAFHAEDQRREAHRLRTEDGLTGALNRQSFVENLKAAEAQRNCALIVVNVDQFQAVNDWQGYASGDDVLRGLARRLRAVMRPSDVLGRVGGDEFALLCHDVRTGESAEGILSRVLSVTDDEFCVGGETFAVAMTAGVATTNKDRSGSALLAAADRAMREAKTNPASAWAWA